jgi:hypothetical protein
MFIDSWELITKGRGTKNCKVLIKAKGHCQCGCGVNLSSKEIHLRGGAEGAKLEERIITALIKSIGALQLTCRACTNVSGLGDFDLVWITNALHNGELSGDRYKQE